MFVTRQRIPVNGEFYPIGGLNLVTRRAILPCFGCEPIACPFPPSQD